MYQERRKVRRAIQELSNLSNKELADIGISRSDIERVAKNSANRVF